MNAPPFLLTLGLMLCGCGPQVTSGTESAEADAGTGSAATDGNDTAGAPDVPSPEPDMGVPNPCASGELLCDGECIDPSNNNEHCGRCGNQCDNLFTIGPCENGTCPPNYECGGDRTDYRDCNEVCEALDTSCVDGVGCSGARNYYYDLQGVENCEAGVGLGAFEPDAECSTPIDWELKGGLLFENPVAVACCCLQE